MRLTLATAAAAALLNRSSTGLTPQVLSDLLRAPQPVNRIRTCASALSQTLKPGSHQSDSNNSSMSMNGSSSSGTKSGAFEFGLSAGAAVAGVGCMLYPASATGTKGAEASTPYSSSPQTAANATAAAATATAAPPGPPATPTATAMLPAPSSWAFSSGLAAGLGGSPPPLAALEHQVPPQQNSMAQPVDSLRLRSWWEQPAGDGLRQQLQQIVDAEVQRQLQQVTLQWQQASLVDRQLLQQLKQENQKMQQQLADAHQQIAALTSGSSVYAGAVAPGRRVTGLGSGQQHPPTPAPAGPTTSLLLGLQHGPLLNSKPAHEAISAELGGAAPQALAAAAAALPAEPSTVDFLLPNRQLRQAVQTWYAGRTMQQQQHPQANTIDSSAVDAQHRVSGQQWVSQVQANSEPLPERRSLVIRRTLASGIRRRKRAAAIRGPEPLTAEAVIALQREAAQESLRTANSIKEYLEKSGVPLEELKLVFGIIDNETLQACGLLPEGHPTESFHSGSYLYSPATSVVTGQRYLLQNALCGPGVDARGPRTDEQRWQLYALKLAVAGVLLHPAIAHCHGLVLAYTGISMVLPDMAAGPVDKLLQQYSHDHGYTINGKWPALEAEDPEASPARPLDRAALQLVTQIVETTASTLQHVQKVTNGAICASKLCDQLANKMPTNDLNDFKTVLTELNLVHYETPGHWAHTYPPIGYSGLDRVLRTAHDTSKERDIDGEPVAVYSVGTVLYEALQMGWIGPGPDTYCGESKYLKASANKPEARLAVPPETPKELVELLRDCTHPDPSQRPKLDKVLQHLAAFKQQLLEWEADLVVSGGSGKPQ